MISRNANVSLDDPTVTAPDDIEITAELDIIATDDVIAATGPGAEVELRAGRDIDVSRTDLSAGDELQLIAGGNITAVDAVMAALGIEFEEELLTPVGRPMAISKGSVIRELLL